MSNVENIFVYWIRTITIAKLIHMIYGAQMEPIATEVGETSISLQTIDCSSCPGLQESENWCHPKGPCIATQDCSQIIECAKGQQRSNYETHPYGYYYPLPEEDTYILTHAVSFIVGIGANIQVFIKKNQYGRPEVQVDGFGAEYAVNKLVEAHTRLTRFKPPFTEGYGHIHYYDKFYTRNVIHWNWPEAITRGDHARIGVSVLSNLLLLNCDQMTSDGIRRRPAWHTAVDMQSWKNLSTSVHQRESWRLFTEALHRKTSMNKRNITCIVLDAVYARSLFHSACAVNYAKGLTKLEECDIGNIAKRKR